MSAEATAYVWKHSPYTGVAFTIHLAIADVVNDAHENRFWSKASVVAEKARTTRETVSKTMNQMAHDGYLEALDLGSIDLRKSRHQAREVRFLMPVTALSGAPVFEGVRSDVTTDHIEPDVTTDHVGCDEGSHRDVTTDHILGTQEGTQVGTEVSLAGNDENDPKSPRGLTAVANTVLAEWVEATGRNPNQVKMTSTRKGVVRKRLDEGYQEIDLVQAVRGIALSAFHQGDNKDGKKFDDMELALRNGGNVEKFRDLYRAGGEQRPVDAVDRVMAMLEEQDQGMALAGQRALV